MRFAFPVAVLVTLAGSVAVSAPAASAEESQLDCTGKNNVLVKPGIGATATAVASYQSAEAGVLECVGTFQGKKLTGPGQYATVGQFSKDATCTYGSGTGLLRMVLGTESGPVQLDAPFKFTYPALPTGAGPMVGKMQFDNDDFAGKFTFTPTKGDCVQTPITGLRIADVFDFVS
jgi:hypothetical protein